MRLYCEEEGEGKTLVFLHGLMGSSGNWRTIRHALAPFFRVLCLDLPNHGKSPRRDVYDMRVLAGDVRETLEAEDATHAILVGHSMGGKVAMQLAIDHPDCVSALVSVDMTPFAFPPVHLFSLRACQELPVATATRRDDLDAELARLVPLPPVTRNFLLKNVARTPDGHYVWAVPLDAILANYAVVSDALSFSSPCQLPTLFLFGEKSPFRFSKDETRIRAWFPRVTFASIPDAGHLIHVDQPEAFLREIRRFAAGE